MTNRVERRPPPQRRQAPTPSLSAKELKAITPLIRPWYDANKALGETADAFRAQCENELEHNGALSGADRKAIEHLSGHASFTDGVGNNTIQIDILDMLDKALQKADKGMIGMTLNIVRQKLPSSPADKGQGIFRDVEARAALDTQGSRAVAGEDAKRETLKDNMNARLAEIDPAISTLSCDKAKQALSDLATDMKHKWDAALGALEAFAEAAPSLAKPQPSKGKG